MKKLFTLLTILTITRLFAQENLPLITAQYNNEDLFAVILDVEKKSGYTFYFSEEWMQGQSIDQEFTNAPLDEVLETVFEGTALNYFLTTDKKVILTLNNIIYSEVPRGFFPDADSTGNKTSTNAVAGDRAPVFYNSSSRSRYAKTVRIGKANKTDNRQRYTLSGKVTNAKTGEPIPDLAIVSQNGNIGAVTDETGNYEIRLRAGSNVLEAKSMGTETLVQEVIMYNDGTLNMSVNENYEQLGEIFLDAQLNENVEDATAGAEEIDVENIKNIPLVLGERDIFKVATTLPGISSAGEGAAGYNVRGGKVDQNLILLDNGVIYNPTHFFGIFSGINPFTTATAEIYKGHIPAKFGGRLSSVFDIKTKDASTTDFNGEASLGPVTSSLMLQTPVVKEKSGLLVGARATYSDYILNALNEESLKNSSASFYDVNLKYNHEINEKNKIVATGYFSKDRFSITSDSLYGYQNALATLNWQWKINDKNRGEVTLSHTDYRFDIDYESESNNSFAQNYAINETNLNADFTYVLSANHQFDYGLSTKLYNVEPGKREPKNNSDIEPLDIEDSRGLESAIYISDNFKVSDKLLLNLGLRYSMYSALGPGTERVYEDGLPKSDATVTSTNTYENNEFIETYGGPEVRVSGRYLFTEDFSAKASYNNTLQYVHTLSNNTTPAPTDTYTLSDFNIEPQRAEQYSLGFYKNLNEAMYELSLEGFYKSSENVLDFKTGSNLFLNPNVETEVLQGNGKSYGVEFMVKKTKGDFNGYLSYTYSRSFIQFDSDFSEERINKGEYFPSNYDKPHDLSVVANYKLTRRYSFSANFVYQTGRPVTFPIGKYQFNNGEYVYYSQRNEFRIPDYYRLDLGVNIEGNHKKNKPGHSFINISVYNVLGRNNPYSVFFVTKSGEVKAYQSSIFSVPVPTITYNFKF